MSSLVINVLQGPGLTPSKPVISLGFAQRRMLESGRQQSSDLIIDKDYSLKLIMAKGKIRL